MRGCVSAGMIAAVSTIGLMDSFDAVYGSSAGSLVGAYAIAGQVRGIGRHALRLSLLCMGFLRPSQKIFLELDVNDARAHCCFCACGELLVLLYCLSCV